jgi:hypothetical protein
VGFEPQCKNQEIFTLPEKSLRHAGDLIILDEV